MKTPNYFKLVLSVSILFLSFSAANAQFDGYALYNDLGSYTTYLIDENGDIAKTWSSNDAGNYTVHLKEDGNLVRGAEYTGNVLWAPAIAGKIQEIDPSGTVVWEYIYSNSDHVSHHDFCVLPNGNVILTAYEVKTGAELIAAGWSGSNSDKWPTHFIELQPDGNGSANIVWEWHIWDHLIQDFDNTKANFGNVANNPQLMDINAVAGSTSPWGGGDWFHVNGIDYNPTLDQLVFTSRYASEFFIIDHSTTTAEAARSSGGNSGMGGDFLYRYGNPPNHGVATAQIIPAAVHDPRWIKTGRPDAGYIQFFNNKGGGNSTSTVDAINPPVSGFTYSSYTLPATYDWRHTALAYSSGQSASDRMTNGNVFATVSGEYMYEVNTSGTTVWQYAVGSAKAFRYECDYPGLDILLGPGHCGSVGVEEFSDLNVEVFPNPSNGIVSITGMNNYSRSYSVNVYDISGRQVVSTNNDPRIDLSSFDNGTYIVHVVSAKGEVIVKKVSLIK